MKSIKEQLVEEIKKAEGLLANEHNINQVSFYDGYIKGLKYLSQAIDRVLDDVEKSLFEPKEKIHQLTYEEYSGYYACVEQVKQIIKSKK